MELWNTYQNWETWVQPPNQLLLIVLVLAKFIHWTFFFFFYTYILFPGHWRYNIVHIKSFDKNNLASLKLSFLTCETGLKGDVGYPIRQVTDTRLFRIGLFGDLNRGSVKYKTIGLGLECLRVLQVWELLSPPPPRLYESWSSRPHMWVP